MPIAGYDQQRGLHGTSRVQRRGLRSQSSPHGSSNTPVIYSRTNDMEAGNPSPVPLHPHVSAKPATTIAIVEKEDDNGDDDGDDGNGNGNDDDASDVVTTTRGPAHTINRQPIPTPRPDRISSPLSGTSYPSDGLPGSFPGSSPSSSHGFGSGPGPSGPGPHGPVVSSSSDTSSGGLSGSGEDVLLAFGSIAATLLLLAVAVIVYRIRRGVPVDQLFKLHPNRRNRGYNPRMEPMSPPAYPQSPAPTTTEVWANRLGLPWAGPQGHPEFIARLPQAFVSQNNSKNSTKILGVTISSQRKSPSPSPTGGAKSPPSDLPLRNNRDTSDSAPIIPPLTIDLDSGMGTSVRPKSSYDFNDGLTPLPHQSFMIGPRYGPDPPKDSRFSWSTYAPTAPHSPAGPDDNARASMASSVPRFRTIDSWIQQQNQRLDLDVVREREREEENERVPEVPKKYKTPGQNGGGTIHGGNISDATAFKQHAEDEVAEDEVKHF